MENLPSEIWIHEISRFFDIQTLISLRVTCKYFDDIYRENIIFRNRDVNNSFEETKNHFLEKRQEWKELRNKLSSEEKKKNDNYFYKEFWHGIGSEPWTGYTTIAETEGGSAKNISDEDCFTFSLRTVLSYDCGHCNREHQQMLRLALICEIDVTPRPDSESFRDFNCIFVRLRKRYIGNFLQCLYLSEKHKFGNDNLLQSFCSLIEYVLISNSLLDKQKQFDFATPFLYEILGCYEQFQKELSKLIKEVESTRDEKGRLSKRYPSFYVKLKRLNPKYQFRRLLRMCLFYGADIFKVCSYDVHSDDYFGESKPNVIISGVEETCIARTLRMKDMYFFFFLTTGGNFFFTDSGSKEENTMIREEDCVDFEKLIEHIFLVCENRDFVLNKKYSVVERLEFWKVFLGNVNHDVFRLFGVHCCTSFLFKIIRGQNRKLLKYILRNEEICRILRSKTSEEDGESMFTFACGKRGVMHNIINLLIDKDWNIHHKNRNGETGLLKAIKIRNIQTIIAIISRTEGVRCLEKIGSVHGKRVVDLLLEDPWICWKLRINIK